MLDINDVHKSGFPEKQLEEVTLYAGSVVPNGGAIPLSVPLTELEDIEIFYKFIDGTQQASVKIKASALLEMMSDPTTTTYHVAGYTAPGTSSTESRIGLNLAASTGNSLVVSVVTLYTLSKEGVYKIIGYKKRYAVENNSVIIPVNGGLNVAVNSRYEVDLPAEFYEADGSVKKGVQVRAELNLSGVVYSGWAEYELETIYLANTTSIFDIGCKARILGDKVVVDTAGYGNQRTANKQADLVWTQIQNPWGMDTDIDAAPCRVVATLNDAYQIQKYELHSMSADAELKPVVLKPRAYSTATSLDITSSGYKWADFERIEFVPLNSDGIKAYARLVVDGQDLTSYPTSWVSHGGYNDAAANYFLVVSATSDTTASVIFNNSAVVGLGQVVGYKKQYTSVNQSTIIPVNSGLNIGANQRHIVALPAEFHELNDVSQPIKSGVTVRAEIYNDGSKGGDVGWGNTGSYTDGNGARFTNAEILGGVVVVQTGNDGILERNPAYSGHPFGLLSSHVTSAPCRVVATLNDAIMLRSA